MTRVVWVKSLKACKSTIIGHISLYFLVMHSGTTQQCVLLSHNEYGKQGASDYSGQTPTPSAIVECYAGAISVVFMHFKKDIARDRRPSRDASEMFAASSMWETAACTSCMMMYWELLS